MRVLVRCDATPAVGAGRLLRGLAVAEALAARGHQAVVSADIAEAWTAELLDDAQVQVLPAARTAQELQALATDQRADLVHLDADGPDELAEPFADGALPFSTVDDAPSAAPTATTAATARIALAVRLSPEAVDATETDSPPSAGRVRAVGPQFAPLRKAVLEARQRRQWRAGGMGDRLRVLVQLGDEDHAEELLPVVQAIVRADLNTDVLAVAPSHATGMRAESLSSRSVRVLATGHRADLPRLVADHDLVVTRPSRLLWEASCIGTPMALLALTAAEDAYADSWVRADVALSLGRPNAVTANQFRALLRDGMRRAAMSTAGQRLVDGGGAERVVELMEQVVQG
jgi:spore coat polysaccharide biosynthesis predicted glycosyltransferase SpsG